MAWGLATSVAFPLALSVVLFVLLDVRLGQTWLVVVFAVATWTGLVTWTLVSSYAKGARSLRADFGWHLEPSDIGRGIVAGLGALVVTAVAITLLAGDVQAPEEGLLSIRPRGVGELVAFGLVAIIGAPVVEELFFRGLFLRSVERRYGTRWAVVVTSAVFGLVHVPDRASFGIGLAFAPPFVLGVVLAALAVRTKRLGSSVIAHASVNAVAFVGLAVAALQS